nr:MAG TPA: Transcription factor TFIID complex subunit 8 C-term [Caudoviricetes sp.]
MWSFAQSCWAPVFPGCHSYRIIKRSQFINYR